MNELNIVGIAGSLRRASTNRALLHAAVELSPEGLRIREEPIGDLPHYDGDIDVDGERPAAVERLKRSIAEADGVLIVTPEYNHSVPGVLKNAIDWVSRPAFASPLAHKPVAMASVSPGAIGGARAQLHLETILLSTNASLFRHRGVVVGGSGSKFEDGQLVDEGTRDFLGAFLTQYRDWLRVSTAST